MAEKSERPAPTFRRATDIVGKGDSEGLDALAGRDVLLRGARSEPRTYGGKENSFTTLDVSELDNLDVITPYHSWSSAIASRLAGIPADDFPVVVSFVKARTARGFSVWTIE
jgi:hypothetical protein